ncbi:MAG: Transcriptional regulatory protein LiaR [Chroococcopsis gigantea SAG 12.99]|jgi:DNA-binding NarL/FixJ family response regulator|nr:response regulator transcription factor [Chlorogloea purpurea SAG 13.99]MDV3000472.1 Transcriptional regulatory protein LiaR [Chroococcopsis gigantea SAG 12.99]
MTNISFIIVEDHDLTRIALNNALSQYRQLDCLGEANSGKKGLRLTEQMEPDVVLVDLDLPDIDGIELTRKLKHLRKPPKVLILTAHEHENQILEVFAAGADSYCLKTQSMDVLVQAMKYTAEGNAWIDPKIAKVILNRSQNNIPGAIVDYDLTDRELQVLQLIVDGCSNAEIADKLEITIGTVKTHVRNILTKLSASDRTQAAVRALRCGLVH